MSRYRRIEVCIWNDAKFRGLSDNGKLAFIFVLTHPQMTSLGAMRASIAGLAAEIGWTTKAFREAFLEAFHKGMVEINEEASFVAFPNFLKHNPPESPNVVKSWANQVPMIPECEEQVLLFKRVKDFVEALPKAFTKALPKGMPNPEPEPEPEPEPDSLCSGARIENSKSLKNISSEAVRLSDLLLELIRTRKPDFVRRGNWAKDIDLMLRIDKRTTADVEAVIRWAQADCIPRGSAGFCWATNILSGAKLREKFDRLQMDMKGRINGRTEETRRRFADDDATYEGVTVGDD